MTTLFDNINYISPEKKKITEREAAQALRNAWKRIFKKYPSDKSLACLWAKTKLETGKFQVGFIDFNFGNTKSKIDNELFTMFKCGEEISLEQANKLISETPDLVKIISVYKKNGKDWTSVIILPGHPWSKFQAFKTLEDGAENYIRFLSEKTRYKLAWQKVLEGDPEGFSHELKIGGYYTGNEKKYTDGVVKNYNDFMNRIDELVTELEPVTLRSTELQNVDLKNVPDFKSTLLTDDSSFHENFPVLQRIILTNEETKKSLCIKGDLSIFKINKQDQKNNIFILILTTIMGIIYYLISIFYK